MTPTSRRPFVLLAWAMMLALAAALAPATAGLPGEGTQTITAAPLAAPDNSIVLQPFLSGLTSPVLIANAGDGSNRLFVVEQAGVIKVVVNGAVRPTPFLDIRSLIVSGGEQGLLGLAFHPDYEHNGRFFVFYTAKPPPGAQCLNSTDPASNCGDNTLAEYHVSGGDPNVANPASARILFALRDQAVNHNAGMLGFSPKDAPGYLYVSTGDEGGGGDTFGNSQNLNSLFAKILRLDVDNIPSGQTYGIPPTNPFVGQSGVRPETWAYGLRNPWRWSFDRQTGDLFIGDVGQNLYEEIDVMPSLLTGQSGRNFGWNIREGFHCNFVMTCPNVGFTDPILEYDHSFGCAVIGGYRYRGPVYPALQGRYFYGDDCSGLIWKATATGTSWSSVVALDTDQMITAFGEDETGELYVVGLFGSIFQLVQAPPDCGNSGRPRVALRATRTGAGTYSVTVSVSDSPTVLDNALQSVAFTRITNASVTFGGQLDQQSPFTVSLPDGSRTTGFTVRRITPGQVMHLDLRVTDHCGVWSTFFGTGRSAP